MADLREPMPPRPPRCANPVCPHEDGKWGMQLQETYAELERRISDLRAFEREYRSRLTAYHEGLVRELRGETDA